MTLLLLLKPVYPPDAVGTATEIFSANGAEVGTAVAVFSANGVGTRLPYPNHVPPFTAFVVATPSAELSLLEQAVADALDATPAAFAPVDLIAVAEGEAAESEGVDAVLSDPDGPVTASVVLVSTATDSTVEIVSPSTATVSVDLGVTATVSLEE